MRIAMLLGSGSSVPGGMPTVGDITARVLSGENVLWNGSDYRVFDELPPSHEVFTEGVAEVIRFVGDLKQLCDDYFQSQEKNRTANYEDIAYVARQIEDGLLSEYENPALLPLNERFSVEIGRTPEELARLAGTSADYIEDIVRALLGRRPLGPLDHLVAIVDAAADGAVDDLTLATLNHDLVLERTFGDAGTRYSDGFEDLFGTLRVWSDTFSVSRKLLKLHGSIDWWRYNLTRDGWTGQFTARPTDGDPFHARGPDGELLEYPPGGRPQILTGTFNKILSYPSGIYADQHFRFHEALAFADALVVIGYGFRDKAINARLIAWAERPGHRRMVVVHADPIRLGAGARGAIRDKWNRWQQNGLLAFLPEHLSYTTTWDSIKKRLH